MPRELLATFDGSRLVLSAAAEAHLRTLVDEALPNECCALGTGLPGQVEQLHPVRNVAAHPRRAFVADPGELARIVIDADGRGRDITLVFHSHPDSAPVPSALDIEGCLWPAVPHLIMSGQRGDVDARAFVTGSSGSRQVSLHRA